MFRLFLGGDNYCSVYENCLNAGFCREFPHTQQRDIREKARDHLPQYHGLPGGRRSAGTPESTLSIIQNGKKPTEAFSDGVLAIIITIMGP